VGVNIPRRVLLVGAGAFAEEVSDLCLMAGIEVAGWIEGIDPAQATRASRPPVIWVEDQAAFEPDLPVLPAIGSVKRRGIMEQLLGEGRQLATFVHPSAVIAPSATVEAGCVIFPLVVVGARTRIGLGTIINRGALVGHHTTIGPHSFVGPGANVAGKILIGSSVHVGLAAVVRDGITIGDGATVGAGAVVVRDVHPGVTVVGLPARPMETP
jgi:acetyltransferase EpsM